MLVVEYLTFCAWLPKMGHFLVHQIDCMHIISIIENQSLSELEKIQSLKQALARANLLKQIDKSPTHFADDESTTLTTLEDVKAAIKLAIKSKLNEVAIFLIEESVGCEPPEIEDPTQTGSDDDQVLSGFMLLLIACAEGNNGIVQYLWRKYPPNVIYKLIVADGGNKSPLTLAANSNHPEIVQFLIDVPNPSAAFQFEQPYLRDIDNPVLRNLCKQGWIETLKVIWTLADKAVVYSEEYYDLEEKGVHSEELESIGEATNKVATLMTYALEKKENLPVVKFLYNTGLVTGDCARPLRMACRKGYESVVKYLCKKEESCADMLHQAVVAMQLPVAQYLVQKHHINVNELNEKDETPVCALIKSVIQAESVITEEFLAMIQWLKDEGAELDAALLEAEHNGSDDLVCHLKRPIDFLMDECILPRYTLLMKVCRSSAVYLPQIIYSDNREDTEPKLYDAISLLKLLIGELCSLDDEQKKSSRMLRTTYGMLKNLLSICPQTQYPVVQIGLTEEEGAHFLTVLRYLFLMNAKLLRDRWQAEVLGVQPTVTLDWAKAPPRSSVAKTRKRKFSEVKEDLEAELPNKKARGLDKAEDVPVCAPLPMIAVLRDPTLNEERKLEIMKRAKTQGAGFHEKDSDGKFLIHIASELGYVGIVNFLLDLGVDFNLLTCNAIGQQFTILHRFTTDEFRYQTDLTAFHVACIEGQEEVVSALWQRDAHLCYTPLRNYMTPLSIAIYCRRLNIVRFLLETPNIPLALQNDRNLLAEMSIFLNAAAFCGHLEIFQLLWSKLENKEEHHEYDYIASAISGGDHLEMVKFLVESGRASISREDSYCQLRLACRLGRLSIVKYLYQQGVTSEQALLVAVDGMKMPVVRHLLEEQGISASKAVGGMTPLGALILKAIGPSFPIDAQFIELVTILRLYGATPEASLVAERNQRSDLVLILQNPLERWISDVLLDHYALMSRLCSRSFVVLPELLTCDSLEATQPNTVYAGDLLRAYIDGFCTYLAAHTQGVVSEKTYSTLKDLTGSPSTQPAVMELLLTENEKMYCLFILKNLIEFAKEHRIPSDYGYPVNLQWGCKRSSAVAMSIFKRKPEDELDDDKPRKVARTLPDSFTGMI